MTTLAYTNIESRIRHLAQRHGFAVRKSRKRVPSLDNFGGYMLVDAAHNWAVLGSRYDATLEDINTFLAEQVEAARPKKKAPAP